MPSDDDPRQKWVIFARGTGCVFIVTVKDKKSVPEVTELHVMSKWNDQDFDDLG